MVPHTCKWKMGRGILRVVCSDRMKGAEIGREPARRTSWQWLTVSNGNRETMQQEWSCEHRHRLRQCGTSERATGELGEGKARWAGAPGGHWPRTAKNRSEWSRYTQYSQNQGQKQAGSVYTGVFSDASTNLPDRSVHVSASSLAIAHLVSEHSNSSWFHQRAVALTGLIRFIIIYLLQKITGVISDSCGPSSGALLNSTSTIDVLALTFVGHSEHQLEGDTLSIFGV